MWDGWHSSLVLDVCVSFLLSPQTDVTIHAGLDMGWNSLWPPPEHNVEFYSRMLHLLPLHPDAQEHVFAPTHFPPFMHVGSHTPETDLRVFFPPSNRWASLQTGGSYSSDTFDLRSLQGTSTRCSSCTDRRSYRGGCKQLNKSRQVKGISVTEAKILLGVALTVKAYRFDTESRRNRGDTHRRQALYRFLHSDRWDHRELPNQPQMHVCFNRSCRRSFIFIWFKTRVTQHLFQCSQYEKKVKYFSYKEIKNHFNLSHVLSVICFSMCLLALLSSLI